MISLAAFSAQNAIPQNKTNPPRLRITHLRRFDNNVPMMPFAQNLTVRHYENYLEIGFAAVDSLASEFLIYRYRLASIDTGWVETKQNFVHYKNLSDGGYSFEVMAKREAGLWGEPVKIDFVLPSPFWAKLWFILLLTMLTVGSVVYFIFLRVRQLLAIERMRARIAADLHDNIGAGLTEISILSEVGARQSNGGVEHFGKISQISRSLVDGMNDIVWLVNPKKDSLYDLVLQLSNSYQEILTQTGIIFRSNNLDVLQHVHLPMEYRQQLYAIFKEALHNCLKHSSAKEVVLDARIHGKKILIRLQDDGRGFEIGDSHNGNGVENMKMRAKAIGGELRILSLPDSGTVIEFTGGIQN